MIWIPLCRTFMGDGYYETSSGQSVRWNADTQKWQYYSWSMFGGYSWKNVTNDMRFQVSRQKALQYAAISFVKSLVANDETVRPIVLPLYPTQETLSYNWNCLILELVRTL